MLVLTRKMQEKIQIGDSITITVLRVKGRSVRVGIEAPRGVRVMRAELPVEIDAAADGVNAATTQAVAGSKALDADAVDATEEEVDATLPAACLERAKKSQPSVESFRLSRRFRMVIPSAEPLAKAFAASVR